MDVITPIKLIGDIFEIILLSWILYFIYSLIRRTRTYRIFNGILFVIVFYAIATWFDLEATLWIFEKTDIFRIGIFAILIIFSPELRRALSKLTIKNFYRAHKKETRQNLNEIVNACQNIADQKSGALITIEKQDSLDEWLSTGIKQKSNISEMLLETIFYKGSPLHDGSVVIRGSEIIGAKVILPLPNELDYRKQRYGLRHRAAIGLTELCDAICIIVSEENSKISVAENGELNMNLDKENLLKILENKLLNKKHTVTSPLENLVNKITQYNYIKFFTLNITAKLFSVFVAFWIWCIPQQTIDNIPFNILYNPQTSLWESETKSTYYTVKNPTQLTNYKVSLTGSNFHIYRYVLSNTRPRVSLEISGVNKSFNWSNNKDTPINNNLIIKKSIGESEVLIDKVVHIKVKKVNWKGTLNKELDKAEVELDDEISLFGPEEMMIKKYGHHVGSSVSNIFLNTQPTISIDQDDIATFSKSNVAILIDEDIKFWNSPTITKLYNVKVKITGTVSNPIIQNLRERLAFLGQIIDSHIKNINNEDHNHELRKKELLKNDNVTLLDLETSLSDFSSSKIKLEGLKNEEETELKNLEEEMKNMNSSVAKNIFMEIKKQTSIKYQKLYELLVKQIPNNKEYHELVSQKVVALKNDYEKAVTLIETEIPGLRNEIERILKVSENLQNEIDNGNDFNNTLLKSIDKNVTWYDSLKCDISLVDRTLHYEKPGIFWERYEQNEKTISQLSSSLKVIKQQYIDTCSKILSNDLPPNDFVKYIKLNENNKLNKVFQNKLKKHPKIWLQYASIKSQTEQLKQKMIQRKKLLYDIKTEFTYVLVLIKSCDHFHNNIFNKYHSSIDKLITKLGTQKWPRLINTQDIKEKLPKYLENHSIQCSESYLNEQIKKIESDSNLPQWQQQYNLERLKRSGLRSKEISDMKEDLNKIIRYLNEYEELSNKITLYHNKAPNN